jgi:hypothetical protein
METIFVVESPGDITILNSLEDVKVFMGMREIGEPTYLLNGKPKYADEAVENAYLLGSYNVHKIELHDDEKIVVHGEDTPYPTFTIVKKKINILSKSERLDFVNVKGK